MVSEGAEVIANLFAESIKLAYASLERSSHHTGKKGTARGMNDEKVEDVVEFTVTGGSKRMNLDFLPRNPCLLPSEPWVADTGCNF